MTKRELVTTSQLAQLQGVTRGAIIGRVKRGTLRPTMTLPNGNYLFRVEVTK